MTPDDIGTRSARVSVNSYSGYAGLPPLAGLETMQEACTTGLSVSESVNRLKRLHWSLKRLHRIFVSRITGVPIYELKMAFSLHAHYCVEHVGEFAARVKEMRQPPHGLDVTPHASLDLFFEGTLCAADSEAFLPALYACGIRAGIRALQHRIAD